MADDKRTCQPEGVLDGRDGRFCVMPCRSLGMGEPVRKRPCLIQQRFEQMATAFVRFTGQGDGADMIDPRLEVGLLGLGGGISRPGDHDLRRGRERQQRFAAAHADGLKVRDFLRIAERLRGLAGVPKACRERFDGMVRQLRSLAARNTQAQADMERHGQVHVRKLLLRVEVRRIGNDPPAILVGMHVPDRVLMAQHIFDVHLLQELDREVGRLRIHVIDDGLFLFRRGWQHGRGRGKSAFGILPRRRVTRKTPPPHRESPL
jgi:hypothetical protein